MSETAIRHAIKTGRLRRSPQPRQRRAALSPGERADRDAAQAQGAGTAVKRLEERLLACQGELRQAAPHFEPMEGVANAGVLLALPALIGEGLLSSVERIYAPLKAGFYGLHTILLCLVMMALLRIKIIERLSAHQPGEPGILLGLGRVPEVKRCVASSKSSEPTTGGEASRGVDRAVGAERTRRARHPLHRRSREDLYGAQAPTAEDDRAETPSVSARRDGHVGA